MHCRNSTTRLGATALLASGLLASGLLLAVAVTAMAAEPGLLRRPATANNETAAKTATPGQPSFAPPRPSRETTQI